MSANVNYTDQQRIRRLNLDKLPYTFQLRFNEWMIDWRLQKTDTTKCFKLLNILPLFARWHLWLAIWCTGQAAVRCSCHRWFCPLQRTTLPAGRQWNQRHHRDQPAKSWIDTNWYKQTIPLHHRRLKKLHGYVQRFHTVNDETVAKKLIPGYWTMKEIIQMNAQFYGSSI